MHGYGDDPAEEIVETIRESWRATQDAFGRVYHTVLGITDFVHHSKIADLAGCSPNTAKKHLERLVQMGIVERRPTTQTAQYRRHESYVEWREAIQIAAEHTIEEIIERVRELEAQRDDLKAEFGTDGPDGATVYMAESPATIHDRMVAVSEWNSIERDLRLYEVARQLAHNDGHLLPEHVHHD